MGAYGAEVNTTNDDYDSITFIALASGGLINSSVALPSLLLHVAD